MLACQLIDHVLSVQVTGLGSMNVSALMHQLLAVEFVGNSTLHPTIAPSASPTFAGAGSNTAIINAVQVSDSWLAL